MAHGASLAAGSLRPCAVVNQYGDRYKKVRLDVMSLSKAVSYTHLTLPTTPYV